MASEVRLEVLRLLREPGKHFGGQWSADPVEFGVCMTLLAEALSLSQPTMSRHLDLLRQAGFISVRRHQKWSYCRRDEVALSDYLAWLAEEVGVKNCAAPNRHEATPEH